MRRPLIVANWKMHKTVAQSIAYVREFAGRTKRLDAIDLVIAPPFTALTAAADAARGSRIAIASQDVAAQADGPFTGEVSAAMVKDAGAECAVIGHSERRALFGETDATVNAKIGAAMGAGLTPIVCIGETLKEREADRTDEVLDRQIQDGLHGLATTDVARIAIAYEPVWAIGTGRNATVEEASRAHRHIRRRVSEGFGEAAANRCRILYGGSVKPENIEGLMGCADVDGALVGGASLDVESFYQIVTRTGR
jgi:triosephosphate isomerase